MPLQVLLDECHSRSTDRARLSPLFTSLTCHLADDDEEKEQLAAQLDGLSSRWSTLAEQLGQNRSELEVVLGVAKSHEAACERLLPWVPKTLVWMEGAGSLPSEPEAVEQLKTEVEVCLNCLVTL